MISCEVLPCLPCCEACWAISLETLNPPMLHTSSQIFGTTSLQCGLDVDNNEQ